MKVQQEVELKLRLQSLNDLRRVEQAIASTANPPRIHQLDVYLDGPKRPMFTINASVFRVRQRKINDKEDYVLTLKSGSVVKDGVGYAMEVQGHYLAERKWLTFDLKVDGLIEVGRYETIRTVLPFFEYTVELDHTKYEFGDAFEIEIETTDPMNAEKKM
ncbi:hypothetical protein HDU67_009200 [Dinochytrium kinnereticum]|nr:hypothetical protein HDU67_009200 [Dinochytrium kinnereticum]